MEALAGGLVERANGMGALALVVGPVVAITAWRGARFDIEGCSNEAWLAVVSIGFAGLGIAKTGDGLGDGLGCCRGCFCSALGERGIL